MDTPNLFGRIIDLSAYLAEVGVKLSGSGDYLYHAPCHDSLEGKAKQVLTQIGGFDKVTAVPHCCSEAGTLSLSRPDITDDMLTRKREALTEAVTEKQQTVLTNCPSCIQGLGRNRDIIQPQHIAIAIAEKHSGKDWQKLFEVQAKKATVIGF